MSDDLADRLAAEARELWSHVPLDEQPDDDAPGELSTDQHGHIRLKFGLDVWRLVEEPDEGWSASRTRLCTAPLALRVTCWRDGVEIGDAVVPGVRPDLN